MTSTIRDAAAAFAAGSTIALVVDIALQALTGAIRVTGGIQVPWWTRAIENSVMVALALVLWLGAPILGDRIEEIVPHAKVSRRVAWDLVGLGMLALPPGHVLGTWVVLALQLTVADTWTSEGRIFLSGAYYGSVLLSITPWMSAGAIVRAWAHHMID